MYLIDTSVWIDFLRSTNTLAVRRLFRMIEEQIPFGITGVIYQELLQGAASKSQFEQLQAYFSTQRFYHPISPIESYAKAAEMYFACRQAGVTVRSTLDCLIAQISIENQLILLHSDKDFDRIQKTVPALQLEPYNIR